MWIAGMCFGIIVGHATTFRINSVPVLRLYGDIPHVCDRGLFVLACCREQCFDGASQIMCAIVYGVSEFLSQ